MSEVSAAPWPGDCRGAVSLTYDDGHPSQLEIAVPILEEYDLRGTFYVNPRGEAWRERLAPWREVALAGHEVGNHSLSHTCSANISGNRARALETTTLAEVEADVIEAERRLREVIPERGVRTFCYPCYQSDVGQGASRQSYVPVIARHFPAARGQGELPNHPALADLHYLGSWPVAGWMRGEDLIKMAEAAAEQRRWVILTFHYFEQGEPSAWTPGGPYHLPDMPATTLRALCAYLAVQRQRLWTAPVIDVAQQIIAWRQAGGLPI
jgi:peptidoglycan/xylan/chitin deacetylase (PgdA/CDA1 family)